MWTSFVNDPFLNWNIFKNPRGSFKFFLNPAPKFKKKRFKFQNPLKFSKKMTSILCVLIPIYSFSYPLIFHIFSFFSSTRAFKAVHSVYSIIKEYIIFLPHWWLMPYFSCDDLMRITSLQHAVINSRSHRCCYYHSS